MEFKFNIDTADMVKDMNAQMKSRMRNGMTARIDAFFGIERIRLNGSVWVTKNGPGLDQIDDMLTKKLCSDEFQRDIERYFEHNWESMFKECMRKALQYKANGIAFNKVHKLPLTD